MLDLLRTPDRVKFCFADGETAAQRAGGSFSARGARLAAEAAEGEVCIRLEEASRPLCRAMLRWEQKLPPLRVLGVDSSQVVCIAEV